MSLVPILQPHIDSTMMTTYRACRKKFWWEFVCGMRPARTSIDLHAGGAFSASLEAYYRDFYSSDDEDRIDERAHAAELAAYRAFATEWGNYEPPPGHIKTAEKMWEAVIEYIRAFPPLFDRIQPFVKADGSRTFEYSFAIPLDDPGFPRHPISGDPFIYCGRFDLLGIREGRTAWRDEKTSSRLESTWADKWNLRSQFMGYCWALTRCGIPCDTGVVRGVIVTKTQVRIVEAVKIYSQLMIERWYAQLREDLHNLVKCYQIDPEGGLGFGYNFGDTCTSYGKLCSFADLCSSRDPDMWTDEFTIRRWNPLDRNPLRETEHAPS